MLDIGVAGRSGAVDRMRQAMHRDHRYDLEHTHEDHGPRTSIDPVVLHFREAPNYEIRDVRVPGLRKHLETSNRAVVPATFDLHGDFWHGPTWFTLLSVAGIPVLGAELGPYGGADGGKEPLLAAWESKCR